MTPEQYLRWKNFAIRMAHRGWPRLPRKSRRFVASCVKDFFRSLEQDYLREGRWRSNTDPGDRNYGLLSRIRDWDNTDSHSTWRDEYGHSSNGPYISDIVSGMEEHWNPHYWAYDSRDYKRWDERWGTRIRCCIRAGLDVASSPSAGVVGFCVGDLKRMYSGNIPPWIDAFFVNRDARGRFCAPISRAPNDQLVWL